jgi:hypothetical protein
MVIRFPSSDYFTLASTIFRYRLPSRSQGCAWFERKAAHCLLHPLP